MTTPTSIELQYSDARVRIRQHFGKLEDAPSEDLEILLQCLDYIRTEINEQIIIAKMRENVEGAKE